jgi:hypothetical protein
MLFWKRKRQSSFNPNHYRVDAKTYEEEYRIFRFQPYPVLRDLKAVKTVMAVYIPLFIMLAMVSPPLSVAIGVITGAPGTIIFTKKRRPKPAAAVPVSIITGIVSGLWLNYRIGVFPL